MSTDRSVSAEHTFGNTALSEFQFSKAQAVSRNPLTSETIVNFRTSPCEVYGGLRTGVCHSPVDIVSPLQRRNTRLNATF